MAKIYDTTDFPVKDVRLGTPFNKGGVYFIKMSVSNTPIYIQPPKCVIKQGFIKSGKKIFCDLIFSIEDNSFLAWLEQIEEVAKQQIYENRAKWFETELDEHDIENSLASPYKMYKSGKLYIIRANIPNTLGKSDLKIYDESEREIFHEDLKEDTNAITILELKGIKCSVRSFQFDIDIRQMLVVSPVKMFEKCIIRKSHDTRSILEETLESNSHAHLEILPQSEPIVRSIPETKEYEETYRTSDLENVITGVPLRVTGVPLGETQVPVGITGVPLGITQVPVGVRRSLEEELSNPTPNNVFMTHTEMDDTRIPDTTDVLESKNRVLGLTALEPTIDEICEVELDLDKIEEVGSVQLKKRNDVYYKMYKEAKRKATEAKMVALTNYLEAKRIKNTYLLDDSSDESDDDLEKEFDS
jgi:hypothetical protein